LSGCALTPRRRYSSMTAKKISRLGARWDCAAYVTRRPYRRFRNSASCLTEALANLVWRLTRVPLRHAGAHSRRPVLCGDSMTVDPKAVDEELESFLGRRPPFGGWKGEWVGVPLEGRTYLSRELPPRRLVGSVRALVLRGESVLLVNSCPPILSVGGRCEPGETVEQTLLREVAEESGWLVSPLGVVGFVHCRHLDEQRPNWGRPAPDFVDLIFAAVALQFDLGRQSVGELPTELVPIATLEKLSIGEIDRTFLAEALKLRAELAFA
jgi:8-oxo-dGTP pyrophosphatase MutT (NUDIX family)